MDPIRQAHNRASGQKEFLGLPLAQIIGTLNSRNYAGFKPSFFLNIGYELTKDALKASGHYSHCKIYKDRYLDYISKKEYPTLNAWAADHGCTVDNILFGFQKFNNEFSCITYHDLLRILHGDGGTELDAFMERLTVDELGLHDLLVVTPRAIQTYDRYMQ